MYVNEFVMGIITTVLAELLCIIVYALVKSTKGKK